MEITLSDCLEYAGQPVKIYGADYTALMRKLSLLHVLMIGQIYMFPKYTHVCRNLLANYEAVRALLYQDLPDGSTTASEKGLRAPEIALIIMAAIILIGAVISIVVISKQFNR